MNDPHGKFWIWWMTDRRPVVEFYATVEERNEALVEMAERMGEGVDFHVGFDEDDT